MRERASLSVAGDPPRGPVPVVEDVQRGAGLGRPVDVLVGAGERPADGVRVGVAHPLEERC